jgi:hypothetical protein
VIGKKNKFRPFSCALSLLTLAALIGFVCNSGDLGVPNRSHAAFKAKQENTILPLCVEQEEENNAAYDQHHWQEQNANTSYFIEPFTSSYKEVYVNRQALPVNSNKLPHYILFRSMII